MSNEKERGEGGKGEKQDLRVLSELSRFCPVGPHPGVLFDDDL
jgi:hypothetical protein